MDVLFLSRVQFGINISFHYLFPPMSIGLGLLLVVMEGMYMKTKNPHYKEMTKFWSKIFSLFFALGVASGFVQVLSFGNNWSHFSRFVGNVFGSVLAAEGVFAFFLEAGFIGLMLFGWDKVKPLTHYIATILVVSGAHFSAIWIVIANSWMQTPAGYEVIGEGTNARAFITNLWDVYFNPSTLDRLAHVLLGAWILGAFLFMAVGAYYILRKKHEKVGRTSLKIGLITALITLVLQLISADSTARGVSVNQPEKFAALEGIYKTEPYTPISVYGWVDADTETVHSIKIPGLLSFLTYRNFETPVRGLDQFPKSDWANVPLVFQAYHVMILAWGLMVLVALLTWIFWKRLERAKWLLYTIMFSLILPYAANLSGWYTAEFGRQPWVVYKVLRTAKGVTTSIVTGEVIGSLIMFIMIYILLLALFVFLLFRKISHGPVVDQDDPLYRQETQV